MNKNNILSIECKHAFTFLLFEVEKSFLIYPRLKKLTFDLHCVSCLYVMFSLIN